MPLNAEIDSLLDEIKKYFDLKSAIVVNRKDYYYAMRYPDTRIYDPMRKYHNEIDQQLTNTAIAQRDKIIDLLLEDFRFGYNLRYFHVRRLALLLPGAFGFLGYVEGKRIRDFLDAIPAQLKTAVWSQLNNNANRVDPFADWVVMDEDGNFRENLL